MKIHYCPVIATTNRYYELIVNGDTRHFARNDTFRALRFLSEMDV